ncbi:MAG: DUF4147 domain-containing protein [Balneolaceae bacterium]|nr:MAG: DUF4147 domain-containing protein [Balneolaceae bacterium]
MQEKAKSIFLSLLEFVDPSTGMPGILRWNSEKRVCSFYEQSFKIGTDRQIHVIGSGKAAPTMAAAAEQIFSDDLTGGIVIGPPDSKAGLNRIKLLQGTHPLPDEKSVEATEQLLNYIEDIPDGSFVFNLLSGGTSALLCKPSDPVTLQDLQQIYSLLLECGASIQEINTVRKTLSDVKGGKLLQRLKGKTVIDVVISDVPDDDLEAIGSGPTTAQTISFDEAISVAKKYGLDRKIPEKVWSYLLKKREEELKGSEKQSTKEIPDHFSHIISSALSVASEAEIMFGKQGFETFLVKPVWTGLIDDFEEHIWDTFQKVLKNRKSGTPLVLIFFGECTVNIKGDGKGGRNQELALRMALRLRELSNSTIFLSAGTDGIDGPTDVAGALVDNQTIDKAIAKGIDPYPYLSNNDSYHFFRKAGGHIRTGPTGNNVMDLQFLISV